MNSSDTCRRSARGGALILVFALIVPVFIISLAAMALQRSSVMAVEHHAACVRARLNVLGKLAGEIDKLDGIDEIKRNPTHVDAAVREPIETIDGASVSLWARAELQRDTSGIAHIKSVKFFEAPPDALSLKERP